VQTFVEHQGAAPDHPNDRDDKKSRQRGSTTITKIHKSSHSGSGIRRKTTGEPNNMVARSTEGDEEPELMRLEGTNGSQLDTPVHEKMELDAPT
jgi:hypothetical protein